MSGSSHVAKISQKQAAVRGSMKTRSEALIDKLELLMDRVTEEKATPDTVRAATECADKAIQLMRLNFEAHKYFAEAGIEPGADQ